MASWLSVVDDRMEPTVKFPAAMVFTSHVTAVLVDTVPSVRLTVAEKSSWLLIPTEPAVGVIVTEVTVAAPLPPPHAACVKIPTSAAASVNNVLFENRLRIMLSVRTRPNWFHHKGTQV